MTRDEQVNAELETLKLPPARREEARVSFERALDLFDLVRCRAMTRDQQVKEALEILLPPARREEARVSFENALDLMVWVSVLHWKVEINRSKAVTETRAAQHRALCKLRATHKALLATVSGMVGGLDLATIENAIAAFEQLNTRVRYCYEFYPDFAGKWKQGFAVALAYELLLHWWGSDEFITKTRKGPWWRLSAILYGDRDADLFRHMREFKPERSPLRLEQTRTSQK